MWWGRGVFELGLHDYLADHRCPPPLVPAYCQSPPLHSPCCAVYSSPPGCTASDAAAPAPPVRPELFAGDRAEVALEKGLVLVKGQVHLGRVGWADRARAMMIMMMMVVVVVVE